MPVGLGLVVFHLAAQQVGSGNQPGKVVAAGMPVKAISLRPNAMLRTVVSRSRGNRHSLRLEGLDLETRKLPTVHGARVRVP